MYQLSGITDSSNNTIVSGVSYDAANQLLGITYNGVNETRIYNALNQLTNITAGADENLTYNYPAGANNGKLSSMSNAISGETVTYTYDSLNRLLTANGSGWGEQYGFDPFGNLTTKQVIAGSGPSLSQSVNTATNRITGGSYDANGNTTSVFNNGFTYGLGYDVENRLVAASYSAGYLEYAYDAQNRRIWSWPGSTDIYGQGNPDGYLVSLYSPAGQKLGTFEISVYNSSLTGMTLTTLSTLKTSDQYFGGRRLAVMDQLGSVVENSGSQVQGYYPWGEPKGTVNPQDTWNFATYWADSFTGLDYANNRYYSNAYGRFMTPDPYEGTSGGSGDPNNPQSWNHYSYVEGDPVNNVDPTGEFTLSACATWGSISWLCSPFSGLWQTITTTGSSVPNQNACVMGLLPACNPAIQQAVQVAQALATLVNNVTAKTCSIAPDGRTIGLNGALGILGGVAGSAEIVLDYHTGQAMLVLAGGFGTTGAAAQVGVSTGFIFGQGDSVPNYASGGNSSVSASLPSGLGITLTSNSGGITGNLLNLNALSATAAQIGVSAGLVSLTGGFSVIAQNTIAQIPLGSYLTGPAAALVTPLDALFYGFQSSCH